MKKNWKLAKNDFLDMLANNKIKIDSKLARESAIKKIFNQILKYSIQDGESNDRLTQKEQ